MGLNVGQPDTGGVARFASSKNNNVGSFKPTNMLLFIKSPKLNIRLMDTLWGLGWVTIPVLYGVASIILRFWLKEAYGVKLVMVGALMFSWSLS